MVIATLVPVLFGVLGGLANNLYSTKTGIGLDRKQALSNIGIGAVAGVLTIAVLGLTGPVGLAAAFLVGYGLIDIKDLVDRDTLKNSLLGE